MDLPAVVNLSAELFFSTHRILISCIEREAARDSKRLPQVADWMNSLSILPPLWIQDMPLASKHSGESPTQSLRVGI